MEPLSTSVAAAATAAEKAGLLGKIYTDLAQPGVKKVGKALGTVFELSNVLVTPIWMVNEYVGAKKEVFRRNMAALKDRIDTIPEEKVCEVPPEIGVPIVDKLTYVTNEQIRDAYINLLSKAASEDTVMMAHPSFIAIIDRLSADEARIINYLKDSNFVCFLRMVLKEEKSRGTYTVFPYVTTIPTEAGLAFPNNIVVYINNLLASGVFNVTPGISKNDDRIYAELFELSEALLPQVQKFCDESNQEIAQSELAGKMNYVVGKPEKGFLEITAFGQLFIKACTST